MLATIYAINFLIIFLSLQMTTGRTVNIALQKSAQHWNE